MKLPRVRGRHGRRPMPRLRSFGGLAAALVGATLLCGCAKAVGAVHAEPPPPIAANSDFTTGPQPQFGPVVDPIEPDRPDVTNGTHIVDVGLLQIEIGGQYARTG